MTHKLLIKVEKFELLDACTKRAFTVEENPPEGDSISIPYRAKTL